MLRTEKKMAENETKKKEIIIDRNLHVETSIKKSDIAFFDV